MPYVATLTLDELDHLTLDQLDSLELAESVTVTDADLLSLLQFNIRAFTRILPAGLSTTGELSHLLGLYSGIEVGEVEGAAYYPPQAALSRMHVRTEAITRKHVATRGIQRIHVRTEELDSNG
jgi:hypothetical protein